MKRLIPCLFMLCVLAPLAMGADGQQLLQSLSSQNANALCVVRCRLQEEIGPRVMGGMGLCIDKSGLIMTSALDPRLRPETIQSLEIILPGQERKTLQAELLGMDPLSGLSFVRATEPANWSVIQFHASSKLQVGDRVASVGVGLDDPALPLTVGLGYVSSIRHRPGRQILVTGGTLTSPGSVVFDADSRAIGLVAAQPFQAYQGMLQQRAISLPLKNEERTISFIPVEEFVYVLQNIPRGGKARRLPWIGVGRFSPVSEDLAEAKGITSPAVMVDQIVPGQAGDKAGLKNRDVIVGMNGQPLEDFASAQLISANFVRELMRMPIGSKVTLTVLRDGTTNQVTVTLEAMPTLPSEAKRIYQPQIGLLAREQVLLDSVVEGVADRADGLIVIGVANRSPAAQAGLMSGDIIRGINGKRVDTVQQAKTVIDTALSNKLPLQLTIQRGAEQQQLTINTTP